MNTWSAMSGASEGSFEGDAGQWDELVSSTVRGARLDHTVPGVVTVWSPDADVRLNWLDRDGCCIGSDLVPAGEERTVATRGTYMQPAVRIPGQGHDTRIT